MSGQPLHDFDAAVRELKRTVWATLEPPLTRLTGWLNRLLGYGPGRG